MSAGPDPQVSVDMIEQTRKQINRLFEEVARMTEAELPPSEFYGEFLKRALQALAAPAGAVWLKTPQGNLQLQYQINMQQIGLNRNESSRQSHDELLRLVCQQAKQTHLTPHSSAGTPEGNNPAPGNPTDFLILLVPILVDKQVAGLVEIFQMPDRHPNAIPGFLAFLAHMAELASRYQRNQITSQLVRQQQLWGQLETFARQVHASLNVTEVAYVLANEGRRLIDCDRVSVAIRRGTRTAVEAVSGADIVEKRSNLVQLMRELFDSVMEWGEKLVYAGSKDDTLPPRVHKALDLYLAESNSKLLVVLPLQDEREKESSKPPRSAMIMECFEPATAPEQLTARLEVVGRHAAPALYNAVEHQRIPFRFIWMPLAHIQDGLGGKARAITFSVIAGVVLAVLAMIFVPYPLKMEANGSLMPKTRGYICPPEAGRITHFLVTPGQEGLPEDSIVGEIFSSELAGNMPFTRADIETLEREVQSLRAASSKENIDTTQRLRISEQLQNAELQLNQRQQARALWVERFHPIEDKPGHFKLLTPKFPPQKEARHHHPEWTVLTRDFRENYEGRYVRPSEQVMMVGDTKGPWEVELKIPQKHIGQVLRAYEDMNTDVLDVDLLVKSTPTKVYKGKLKRSQIGGEARTEPTEKNETEPVVLAWVTIRDESIPADDQIPAVLLVTGTEVHARIRCGNHPMGYSLFYGVWEWIYEKLFNYL